jgi:hypothetical protein
LVNTLNGTVEQIKKLRVDKAGTNDVIERLTEGIQNLILTATQVVTEKVSIVIKQMPTYIANNSAPSFRQTGR